MLKRSKLKELVEMIVLETLGETADGVSDAEAFAARGVFAPQDPVKVTKRGGDYYIYREIPIVMTPELYAYSKINPEHLTVGNDVDDELTPDGVFVTEWEVAIDVDSTYSKGSKARLYGHPDTWHPGDPDDFEVSDYTVAGLLAFGKMLEFSPADSARLRTVLGDLSEDEIDKIRDEYLENVDSGFDPPDYGDY